MLVFWEAKNHEFVVITNFFESIKGKGADFGYCCQGLQG